MAVLLPTPAVNDMGRGKTVEDWDAWTASMQAKHGNGNGHGKSLEIEAQRLLPTPKASDGPNGGPGMRNGRGVADALPGVVGKLLPTPRAQNGEEVNAKPYHRYYKGQLMTNNLENAVGQVIDPGMTQLTVSGEPSVVAPSVHSEQTLLPTPVASDHRDSIVEQSGSHRPGDLMLPSAVQPERFGPYTAAIHRWEQVLGRPAPSPTEPGKDGRPRLSPAFVEFMMGLPDGWVCDTGIPRNAQLKALGNGVVPQQAALALSMLLPRLYVCGAAKDAEEVA